MTTDMVDILIKIASKYKTENGCQISITSPAGRYLDTLTVSKVYDNGTIAGYSEDMGIDTAYYIPSVMLDAIAQPLSAG